VIGNYILGGSSLASRLGNRVRQQEGLSYGIASYFAADALDKRASVTLMAIFNPVNTAQVEQAIREEVERLLQDGVSSDELADATKGYLDEQQVDRANDSFLVQALADTAYAGRTMDYYVDLERKIKRLTTKQVNAALARHIKFQRLAVVVAGDFSAKTTGEEASQANDDVANDDSQAGDGKQGDVDANDGGDAPPAKKRPGGKKAGR
jgi:zinc protease